MKTKRIISWVLTVAMIVSVLCSVQLPAFAAGSYEVATAEELVQAVKDGKTAITITKDISLTETLKPAGKLTLIGKGDVTLSGTCGNFIYSADDVTIQNLTVTGATSSAIFMIDGNLVISNSTFTGNSGANGGAVVFSAVVEEKVEEETSDRVVIINGGAAEKEVSERSVTLINSVFKNNSAAKFGGAIAVGVANTIKATNCIFEGNTAEEGGALYARTEWNVMQFTGTTFSNNTAKGGGAIRNVNGSVEAWDTTFDANKATAYHGGAIYGWHLFVELHDCTTTKNTAKGNGGAIWVETTDGWPANQYSQIIVHGGDVSTNTAGGQGGAIGGQNMAYGITVDGGATVSNNKALEAGALYSWAGIYINDSTVSGNKADQNGGAIWCNWEVKANNSTFSNNYCKWFGGVAYGMLGDMVFNNCTFTKNTADPYFRGGAGVACNYQMNIYSNECTYSGNRSWGSKALVAQQGSVVYGSVPTDAVAAPKNVVNVSVQAESGYNIFSVTIPGATESEGVYTVVSEEGTGVDIDISAIMKETRSCTIEQFTDITDRMEYHRAIDYVVENGIMDGTGNNEFSPNVNITRGMVITTFYRMNGSPEVTAASTFGDVPAGQWYTNAVIWGVEAGIINGYDNGNFGPNDLITREQLATLLYRYSKFAGENVAKSAELGAGYANVDKVSEYALTAVKWASALNLFNADPADPVDLVGNVTRADLAVALYVMAGGTISSGAPSSGSGNSGSIGNTGKGAEYLSNGTDWAEDGELNVIALGNSFSEDTLFYFREVAKSYFAETGEDIDINVYNLRIGGCTIAQHASNARNNAANYDLTIAVDGTPGSFKNLAPTQSGKYTMEYGLNAMDWDFVIMQNASHLVLEDAYYDDLEYLIGYVREKVGPDAKLIWNMNWAYQDDCTTNANFPLFNNDQMTMYNAITSCTQRIIKPWVCFEAINPNGTAIQNVRTAFDDIITRDGYHLDMAAGRYTVAMTLFKTLTGADLSQVTYVPQGVDTIVSYEVNDELWELCKQAVNDAIANPFEITQ